MANKKKKKTSKAKKDPAPAPPKKSRANLITVVIIVVVIAGGALIASAVRSSGGKKQQLVNGGKTELCSAIETTKMEDRNHIEPTPTQYQQDPPIGGNHWGSPPPVNDGFFETELPKESLVHNLEHGQIVVYYPKDDKDTAQKVKAFVNEQGAFIVAVPRSTPFPGGAKVAYSAWGHSQLCTAFDKGALSAFQSLYKNQGPERVRMG